MTIQQAKDQAARELYGSTFKQAITFVPSSAMGDLTDRAMEIYAEAKEREAFEAARAYTQIKGVTDFVKTKYPTFEHYKNRKL